ncbi:MAG: FAD-binding protein [Pseudomonadota bacterium]
MNSEKTPLKHLAYFKTGGSSLGVYSPSSHQQLGECLREISDTGKPLLVLGGGTNSLVLDDTFPGYVIIFRNMKTIKQISETVFEVDAGVTNTEFSEFAFSRSLSGAEWMNFLPGEIGGTVRMNARCYGGEISQIVSKISCYDPSGKELEFKGSEVFRGYKDTLLMENKAIVSKVQISLTPSGSPDKSREKMDFCRTDRERKGQFLFPTCGCVFKNNYHPDVSVSSGLLLELAGAKLLEFDKAKVSEKHANFVYNQGSDARSILELTFQMRDLVWQKFGVWLEYEMEILGEWSDDLKVKIGEVRSSPRNPEQKAALKLAKEKFESMSKAPK